MLTIAISLLFGLLAFAALAQIWLAVGAGAARGRQIVAELASLAPATVAVRARRARRGWQPALAAA